MINSEPHFIGKDVAEILGYSNPLKAIRTHVDQEDRGVNEMDTPGGKQRLIVINESGLYSLIIGSKLPTAKRFKHWVTSEVLPAIRKHGAYAVDELLDDPDLAIKAFTALKEEREKRKALEAQNAVMIPKAVFADAVTTSDSCILIGDLAKLLRQNGVEIGQKRLFEWLRNHGFLIKRRGADWNSPTQRAMEMGLFEIKETAITHSDGHVTISKTTKVTGKGQIYFVNRFLGEVVE
ncbi:phage antirepressor KilAC domain-containing protein [Erysipelotrichaceae bacterium 66-17]